MKTFFKKYSHAWLLSYFFIYMIWFFVLENRMVTSVTYLHSPLDNLIPFQEWFVIPYFLWFPYLFIGIGYLFLKDAREFYQLGAMLAIGLTVCLLIYTIWPNGQMLRPATFARNNICTRIVHWLYAFDTPTNVCPSIHVYNSLVVHIALWRSRHLKNRPYIRYGSLILTFLICASTVFLKQHSIIDGICAIILSIIMYGFVYVLYPQLRHCKKETGGAGF